MRQGLQFYSRVNGDKEKLDLDLTHNSNATQLYSFAGYKRLGYQGIELEQFKVFKSYVEEKQQYALEQKLPQLGLELLDISVSIETFK